jgi:hypothetical protein
MNVALEGMPYLQRKELNILPLPMHVVRGSTVTLSEEDILMKITLPLLWTLSYAKYSALRANNPKSKTRYLFGSFFIITRKTYEAVGTHKVVKSEIVEDGALGRYANGQRRCEVCSVFLNWGGLSCLCCGHKLRTKARSTKK